MHRTAATAGGGDIVSTYIDDDGFEYAIVDSDAAGHFVGDSAKLKSTQPADLWTAAANGSRTRIDTQGDIALQAVDEQEGTIFRIASYDG